MKDPAVLFYFQDFLVGTQFMTDDEVGKYIKVLCHQADKGALTHLQVQRLCGGTIPDAIMDKLTIDLDGNLYQERMRFEREKRIKYSESRSKNRTNICKTYEQHMENENEDINVINNKGKNKKFIPPKKEEVIAYFELNGYLAETGEKAFNYYEVGDWKDKDGKQVKNWKQKMHVWFKPESKKVSSTWNIKTGKII